MRIGKRMDLVSGVLTKGLLLMIGGLFFSGAALFAQSRRVALVIGNSAYEHVTPLNNPINDAQDIGVTLENLGFTVSRVLDASKGDIQRAVDEFKDQASQRGTEMALFYYSGHGVEYEGINYIVPVSADIGDSYALIDQAVSLERVVNAMEQGRSEFNMVVLDACRDNPFFKSRGGGRGLAAMSGGSKGSMIVFATSPGDVAADGSGRNSPFTRAFIEHAATPGLELSTLMRKVTGTVKDATGGRQTPWFNASYSGDMYLGAVEELTNAAARAGAVNREIAALEAEIAQREEAIAAARDRTERIRLEAEQQRARAEEAARRMQAEQLTEIALRAREAIDQKEADAALRRQMEEQLATERVRLSQQAQERRARLEDLKKTGGGGLGAWEQLKTIASLVQAVADIEERFDAAMAAMEKEVDALYGQQAAAVRENNPKEPFETQEEYEAHIDELTAEIRARQEAEIAKRRDDLGGSRETELSGLKEQLALARAELGQSRFVLGAGTTTVTVAPFSAEDKSFPMEVEARHEEVAFNIPVSYTLGGTSRDALRDEYYRIYRADQSGGLAGELSYRAFELSPNIWVLQPTETRVVNLLENDAVLTGSRQSGGAMVVSTERKLEKLAAVLRLESGVPGEEAVLKLDGKAVGKTPYTLGVDETRLGTTRAEFEWPDGRRLAYSIPINRGVNAAAVALPERLERRGMALFSGLPVDTEVELEGITKQADEGLAIFTLPEGRHRYSLSGYWLMKPGSGELEISSMDSPLVNVGLAEAQTSVAGEIALPLAEDLPRKVEMDVRFYSLDGREAAAQSVYRDGVLVARLEEGEYQMALSRSDDPYLAVVRPAQVRGQQKIEEAVLKLPLSARYRLETARANLERTEKKMAFKKLRGPLGGVLLGTGVLGLGAVVLSALLSEEARTVYEGASSTAVTNTAREDLAAWNGVFIAGAIAGSIGTSLGTGLLVFGPSGDKLRVQRDELRDEIILYEDEYRGLLSQQPLYGRTK